MNLQSTDRYLLTRSSVVTPTNTEYCFHSIPTDSTPVGSSARTRRLMTIMSNRSKSLPAIPSSLQESKSIYLTPSSNATSNGGYRSNTPPTLRRHTSDPSRCSISARVPLSDELTFPALLRRSNKSNINNGRNSVQHDNPQDSSRRRTVANTQVPKVKLLPKRSSNWRDEKLY